MPEPLVIVGRHTGPAARSAVRAGFEPWCVDPTPAPELEQLGRVVACDARRWPGSAVAALARCPADATLLVAAGLLTDPGALAAAAFGRPLASPSAEATRSVRDPAALATLPARRGLGIPAVRTHQSLARRLTQLVLGAFARRRYLVKPVLGEHGRGVGFWTPGQRLEPGTYLQQHVRGETHTAVFRGDGWSSVLLGVTERLTGVRALGGAGFDYGGDIGPTHLSPRQRDALAHIGVVLTQRHDLRGLFAVELVMDHSGRLWPVSVAPRYPEAAGILEAAGVVPATLSETPAAGRARRSAPPPAAVHGQAVVRAARTGVMPETLDGALAAACHDTPTPGTRLAPGDRIGLVTAAGPGRDACEKKLLTLAARLRAAAEP